MSTRQLRVNDSDQIRKKLREFTGKKMNIVLTDQTVMLVEIRSVDDNSVAATNMRLKKVNIPFEKISEIYFDTIE